MEPLLRKITYRLYPNVAEQSAMLAVLGLQCRLYNTLLEEHIRHHQEGLGSYTFARMCKDLTQWRQRSDTLAGLNAQSMQMTAKRVSLAFQAFFRRVQSGATPGFPRFKSPQRFAGWGYKTYGDGWKLQLNDKGGSVRLSGIGTIRMRGKGRFSGTPKTAEVVLSGGQWFLSVTYEVTPEAVARTTGTEAAGFDWGISALLTLAPAGGDTETIQNPRWLKSKLNAAKALARAISLAETKAKVTSGRDIGFPVNAKLKRLYAQQRALHRKVACQRKDFYHKLTSQLVSRFRLLVAEDLAPANMSRAPKPKPAEDGTFLPNGAAAKAGLNRSILDAAPGMFYAMLTTKAEEAASTFALANPFKLKPTQRCHACGKLVPKTLKERVHRCPCGEVCGRDENSAKTSLRWALEGEYWLGTSQSSPDLAVAV